MKQLHRHIVFFLALCPLFIAGPDKAFAQNKEEISATYHTLLDRAIALDTSLTTSDYRTLYLGYTRHPGYKPGRHGSQLAALDSAIAARDFEGAVSVGADLFREAPFMLGVSFALYTCYSELGNYDRARQYQQHFQHMLTTVANTGEGIAPGDPILLLYEEDESYMLDYFALSPSERKVVDNRLAVYTLKYPNERSMRKIFFNIENPRSYFVVRE